MTAIAVACSVLAFSAAAGLSLAAVATALLLLLAPHLYGTGLLSSHLTSLRVVGPTSQSDPCKVAAAEEAAEDRSIGEGGAPWSNILLVVAHPDDESMFFTPTLLTLGRHTLCRLHVLCLSVGNADGIGVIRRHEMVRACAVLGVPQVQLRVVDHPQLQDGMDTRWDVGVVESEVAQAVTDFGIHMLITFDHFGVSGHPNHAAAHFGVRSFLLKHDSHTDPTPQHRQHNGNQHMDSQQARRLDAWQLESTSFLRKYFGMLDVIPSLLVSHWRAGQSRGAQSHVDQSHYPLSRPCFVSPSVRTGVEAMRQHGSQFVWFRQLFILFARYTYVNTLSRIQPPLAETCSSVTRDIVHD